MMPWPARITGRCAELISSSARAIEAEFTTHPGGRAARRRGLPVEVARRLLRVLGDVDQHRTGTAAGRDVERSRTAGARSCARVTR